MKDIKWFANRLRAMNALEVGWRIQQKILQKYEKKKIYSLHCPVYDVTLNYKYSNLNCSIDRLPINWTNKEYDIFTELNIFGAFSYQEYKTLWNAGFQTKNMWPEKDFSYDIKTSQRIDIGDIRTNWELNRHFQFSALAKNYFITNEKSYLEELEELFASWNKHNLYLHGVQWTSAMEIAIRVNSWIYTYCFLEKSYQKNENDRNQKLLDQISKGILTMVDYIIKHRARFSSANNHLIVEMYAVGIAGIFYDYDPWKKLSINTLTKELPKQNFEDGVNKEMSLHYQSFVMEAYGLLMLVMKHNNIGIPESWYKYLTNMTKFLADCCGDYGETIVFGDNDEGKILDLNGGEINHYRYILDLMSCLLEDRYSDLNNLHENLNWIVLGEVIEKSKKKEKYYPELLCTYKDGGYTILRSRDRKIILGIDHADLGFGKIAAHGHADALSFQLFIEGIPVFVDPGTYNYHYMPNDRDVFRSTSMHNTVMVANQEQSEILGPFLWGKKMKSCCEYIKKDINSIKISISVKYKKIVHSRRIDFINDKELIIFDYLKENENLHKKQIFLINPEAEIIPIDDYSLCVLISNYKINISSQNKYALIDYKYSSEYNQFSIGKGIEFLGNRNIFKTVIRIEKS